MKHLLLFLLSIFSLNSILIAQNNQETSPQPLLLSKEALSGIGLRKIDIKKEPEKEFYQKNLYRGKDISVYVVSTGTWNNVIEQYSFDEYVYLLNGQSIVKPKNGNSQVYNSGDHLFMPKGFKGEWEIRSGSNLHYELSVITTQRADSIKVVKDELNIDFHESHLSGCQILLDDKNYYEEILSKGVELTILLKAEKPNERVLQEPTKEKLIHVLTGKITITDYQDQKHAFYTGDFFVLPPGKYNTWKSEGHGMLKYIVVEKTE